MRQSRLKKQAKQHQTQWKDSSREVSQVANRKLLQTRLLCWFVGGTGGARHSVQQVRQESVGEGFGSVNNLMQASEGWEFGITRLANARTASAPRRSMRRQILQQGCRCLAHSYRGSGLACEQGPCLRGATQEFWSWCGSVRPSIGEISR